MKPNKAISSWVKNKGLSFTQEGSIQLGDKFNVDLFSMDNGKTYNQLQLKPSKLVAVKDEIMEEVLSLLISTEAFIKEEASYTFCNQGLRRVVEFNFSSPNSGLKVLKKIYLNRQELDEKLSCLSLEESYFKAGLRQSKSSLDKFVYHKEFCFGRVKIIASDTEISFSILNSKNINTDLITTLFDKYVPRTYIVKDLNISGLAHDYGIGFGLPLGISKEEVEEILEGLDKVVKYLSRVLDIQRIVSSDLLKTDLDKLVLSQTEKVCYYNPYPFCNIFFSLDNKVGQYAFSTVIILKDKSFIEAIESYEAGSSIFYKQSISEGVNSYSYSRSIPIGLNNSSLLEFAKNPLPKELIEVLQLFKEINE